MAAYTKQTWDTTSIFNPTRMNHIEEGIYGASTNIVDNLTSTDATTALSAKQGKVLNDKLTVENISLTGVTWGITINSNYTWFKKVGNIVFFQIFVTGEISGQPTLATGLPTSVRPSTQVWFSGSESNGGTKNPRLVINTNGQLDVLMVGGNATYIYFSGSYPL